MSRFKLKANGEVKAELMRALEAKAETRGIIKAMERTRDRSEVQWIMEERRIKSLERMETDRLESGYSPI